MVVVIPVEPAAARLRLAQDGRQVEEGHPGGAAVARELARVALECGRTQVRPFCAERGLEGGVAIRDLGAVREIGDEEASAASGHDAVQDPERPGEIDRRAQPGFEVARAADAIGVEAPFEHGARDVFPGARAQLRLPPVPEVAGIGRRYVVRNGPEAEPHRWHLAGGEEPGHDEEPGERGLEAPRRRARDVEGGRRQVVCEEHEQHGVGQEERDRVVDELEVVRDVGAHHSEVHRLDAAARAGCRCLEAARHGLVVARHRALDEAVAHEEQAGDPRLPFEAPLPIAEAVRVEPVLESRPVEGRFPDQAQAAERADRVALRPAHVLRAVQARDLRQREREAERELLEAEGAGEPRRDRRHAARAMAHRKGPGAERERGDGRSPPRDMVPRRGRPW